MPIMYNIDDAAPLRFNKAGRNMIQHNVFVCSEDVLPIYYGGTDQDDIITIDNIILNQSSGDDVKRLEGIIEKQKSDVGPRNKRIR